MRAQGLGFRDEALALTRGLRVWGLEVQGGGFGVQGSGLRTLSLGFWGARLRVQFGLRLEGSGFSFQGSGLGCRVEFGVEGLGLKAWALGFRVQKSGCTSRFQRPSYRGGGLVPPRQNRRVTYSPLNKGVVH